MRSGKTQASARLIVEAALTYPGTQYLVARQTYMTLRDTVQRAMLYGDGPIPPLVPTEALRGQSIRTGYVGGEVKRLYLANGSEIAFRSLEENAIEKVRGFTLSGALVDQIEELRFEEGEALWDELGNRLSDGRGPRKAIAICNPAGLEHWVYKRWILQPEPGYKTVHFAIHDNAENLPAELLAEMETHRTNRPHWYRTYALGEWGAIKDAAYIIGNDHRIEDFRLEDAFDRFEAADFGNNGAPWAAVAVDYEGNIIFHDMLYEKAPQGEGLLVSDLCKLILKKREDWGTPWAAFMDPSVWHRLNVANRWGKPAMLADEFAECGVPLTPANNDPRAGLARGRELLRLDPSHVFPPWHHKAGQPGAPRVFFTRRCDRLAGELQSAPLQPLEKRDGGEIVDPTWESRNGHAAAMFRYAVMSRPEASEEPTPFIEDMRSRQVDDVMRARDERRSTRGVAYGTRFT